jgi:hypothetical protein
MTIICTELYTINFIYNSGITKESKKIYKFICGRCSEYNVEYRIPAEGAPIGKLIYSPNQFNVLLA